MATRRSPSPENPALQSIPLRNLSRPPDETGRHSGSTASDHSSGPAHSHGRTPSLLDRVIRRPGYDRLETESPTMRRDRSHSYTPNDDGLFSPEEFANAQIGLSFGSLTSPPDAAFETVSMGAATGIGSSMFAANEADDANLLAKPGRGKSIMKSPSNSGQRHERRSKRASVQFQGGESSTMKGRPSRLGDDLPSLNTNIGANRRPSVSSGIQRLSSDYAQDASQSRSRSLSPSPSPLKRAGSMLREMSERIVNISNDSEMVQQTLKRRSSVGLPRLPRTQSNESAITDIEQDPRLPRPSFHASEAGSEKTPSFDEQPVPQQFFNPKTPVNYPNPLRGKTLGIFGPENRLRRWLLEVLTHPATEPAILVLIIAQTVLLAVYAAPSAAYLAPRSRRWGESFLDYAIFGFFVIYTLEAIARTIVSGFVRNAVEHSTLDPSLGFRKGALAKLGSLFAMQDRKPDNTPGRRPSVEFQPSIVRSFTALPDAQGPGHGRQHQRVRLARRAFLRHSFNRLDFVAVVSFWISFGLRVPGVENEKHVYIFDMLSSLRILRLLGLTAGTTIILRSLKKAAPLLVNIGFLIGFFWLLFGIVGVQSFKSSFLRTCTWIDPAGVESNYSWNVAPENVQFCGGYLNATTGEPWPWLLADGSNGTKHAKGYLCPVNSLCIENPTNPYNNTVSFDNIVQSLELVFVLISANTWSDLMYYLTDSDYLIVALFFAVGIVILSLWLVNLLIAVITSSFQIIREESKQSAFTTQDVHEPHLQEDDPASSKKKNQLAWAFAKSKPFWILIIAFDLIVMALRSSTMSRFRESFIMNTETVVTLLLLLEIVLRILVDRRNFFRSRRNWFDLLIAIVTSIMQIPPIRHSGQPYAWLSTFQILRVYRVVLAISVTRELVMIVFGNAGGILNLILFAFLFTFLAAIMASQMFRGDIPTGDAGGTMTQIQFQNIWNSFIGMYIILSSENWTTIVYDITQFDVGYNTAWLGAAFCIIWFIMANMVILTMFIAVIQESFDVSEDEKRLQQVKAFLKQKEMHGGSGGNLALSSIFKMGRESMRHREALEYQGATMEQLLKDAVVTDFLDEHAEKSKPRPTSAPLTNLSTPVVAPTVLSKLWTAVIGTNDKDPNPFYSQPGFHRANEEFDPRAVAKQVASAAESRRRAQRQYLNRHPKYNVSLFIFKANNPIRRACQYIVGPARGDDRIEGVMPYKPAWFAFSAFTYACIVAMVIIACITTPLYQKEYFEQGILYNNWLVWTDMGFAAVFTIEALIKIIADGFFYTPNAFFRSVWGLIDIVVLASLWVSVITTLFADDSITRGVGALKALRALRLLNISDSARDTFHSIIVIGAYKVLSAAFVSLSLLIPFAILGVNLFNGRFEICNSQYYHGLLTDCVGEWNSTPSGWNVLAPTTVMNPQYSFDNFGSALFILFQIVSQEGWTGVLESGTNIAGLGWQPQNFASVGNAVYFIVFNLLGAVFVLTLFISVFMRNYTEQTGVAYLTADQRSWLELRKLLKQITPSKRSVTDHSKGWQLWCYKLASKKRGKYPRFITSVLLLHLTLLVIEYYPEPTWWSDARQYIFLAFTLIYAFNVIIRIIGLTWSRYRRSSWDLFALVAVSGTLITSVLALSTYELRALDQLYKLCLVSITLLLIPRNNQLDQLFKTAAASLSMIANLLATWFVLFLVFAIAFTQAFSLTRFGPNENGNVNFRNVPKALIVLLRTSIGEGWNSLMQDFSFIQPPYCVTGSSFFDSDCGSENWSRALFIMWNIISMYIFVSLFVSLIYESFSYVYQTSSGLNVVSREEIRRFKAAWLDFDPKGTGYITKEQFPRLLGELSGVFQMRIYDGDFTVKNLIEDCSVQLGAPTSSKRVVAGIDLEKLNQRLNQIPVAEIRARRAQMNVFYHEMLLSADPDRGISFTNCLMILAHYNVISDSKSLRLEEFLRRRARLQRVNESIRRDTVIKFFDTMHWRRRFRQMQRSTGTYAPSPMVIPQIFVEDPDDSPGSSDEAMARDFTETEPLSPRRVTPTLPRIDTSSISGRHSASSMRSPSQMSPGASPTASPRLQSVDTAYYGRERTPPPSPSLGGHSRHGSGIVGNSTLGVMESFDSSAWGESIRRSFTTARRSQGGE